MKKVKRFLLTGIFPIIAFNFFTIYSSLAQELTDIQGWNGTKWGMSKEDIVGVFKDEIVRLPKMEDYSIHYADLGLSNYRIGSGLYNVRFLMDRKTNQLVQINIRPESPPNRVNYDILERLLFDKYGKWTYKNENKEPEKRISRGTVLDRSENISTVWNFKNTVINLSYVMDSEIRIVALSQFNHN